MTNCQAHARHQGAALPRRATRGQGLSQVRRRLPLHLGEPLNSPFNEGDAVVAPDQRFMVLTIAGRPDDAGRGDLYISEQRDGRWSEPRRLPDGINSPATEFCPSLSADGRTFYFTSTRGPAGGPPGRPRDYKELVGRLRGIHNGLGNVYHVPTAVIRGDSR